jgi:monosaccharide-transporting ATPase
LLYLMLVLYAGPEMSESAEPILRMRGVSKHFDGVQALADVDFETRAGEVHALLGQNGAGKSTLIKILTGVYAPDRAEMMLGRQPLRPRSPADAQRRGISTVYQELNLVPTLSAAENLCLGRAPRRWYGVDWRAMRRTARRHLTAFGLRIDVAEPLGTFPIAIQQMVAIARAVAQRARVLVLDEPTSSLDRREADVLFDTMRRLKAQGLSVIFITHFLDEVYRIADRITVLRNGRRVGTYSPSGVPKIELVALMLGRPAREAAALERRCEDALPAERREPRLIARNLGRRGAIEPFDLEVRGAQIVGFAGLLGSGRTEAARLLFGADRRDSGEVRVQGAAHAVRSPRQAIAAGLALTPEDRQAEGLFADMSLRDNIALVVQRRLSRLGWLSRSRHTRIAQRMLRRLGIVTAGPQQPVRNLSGGNQQKVILARWLACDPQLWILDEPTRGIDVGAKAEIERLIADLARGGASAVFVSSELDELVRVCEHLLVLRERRVVGELRGMQVNEQQVMDCIAGEAADAP